MKQTKKETINKSHWKSFYFMTNAYISGKKHTEVGSILQTRKYCRCHKLFSKSKDGVIFRASFVQDISYKIKDYITITYNFLWTRV